MTMVFPGTAHKTTLRHMSVAHVVGMAFLAVGVALMLGAGPRGAAQAASDDEITAFLTATGFDKAIEGLQVSAGSGMAGLGSETFGVQYTLLANEVFDPEEMTERARQMIGAVMPDDVMAASTAFYSSPAGRRIVAVENIAQLTDDADTDPEGEAILAGLRAARDPRVEVLGAINRAAAPIDVTLRALTEIQLRYILAASDAGVIDQQFEPEVLREILFEQIKELTPVIEEGALVNSAYTYRDISDDDLALYLDALEGPSMRQAYEVMNAILYQIMVERYEVLGLRLTELQPSEEL